MQGKTHVAVGAAVAISLLHPVSSAEVVAFGIAGAAGGLLPDVDLLKSNGSRDASACVGMLILVCTGCLGIDYVAPFGLGEFLAKSAGQAVYPGLIWLFFILAFGVSRPHREFTHSVLFIACIAGGTFVACPALLKPVFFGMVSHLGLDLLNKRGLCLLWPSKKRFCAAVCTSGGVVDAAFGFAAFFALVIALVLRS